MDTARKEETTPTSTKNAPLMSDSRNFMQSTTNTDLTNKLCDRSIEKARTEYRNEELSRINISNVDLTVTDESVCVAPYSALSYRRDSVQSNQSCFAQSENSMPCFLTQSFVESPTLTKNMLALESIRLDSQFTSLEERRFKSVPKDFLQSDSDSGSQSSTQSQTSKFDPKYLCASLVIKQPKIQWSNFCQEPESDSSWSQETASSCEEHTQRNRIRAHVLHRIQSSDYESTLDETTDASRTFSSQEGNESSVFVSCDQPTDVDLSIDDINVMKSMPSSNEKYEDMDETFDTTQKHKLTGTDRYSGVNEDFDETFDTGQEQRDSETELNPLIQNQDTKCPSAGYDQSLNSDKGDSDNNEHNNSEILCGFIPSISYQHSEEIMEEVENLEVTEKNTGNRNENDQIDSSNNDNLKKSGSPSSEQEHKVDKCRDSAANVSERSVHVARCADDTRMQQFPMESIMMEFEKSMTMVEDVKEGCDRTLWSQVPDVETPEQTLSVGIELEEVFNCVRGEEEKPEITFGGGVFKVSAVGETEGRCEEIEKEMSGRKCAAVKVEGSQEEEGSTFGSGQITCIGIKSQNSQDKEEIKVSGSEDKVDGSRVELEAKEDRSEGLKVKMGDGKDLEDRMKDLNSLDDREKECQFEIRDFKISDIDTEVKGCDTAVKDCDTAVKDCDIAVKNGDTEVKDCDTEVKDCDTEVKDCDTEVKYCDTAVKDCSTTVKDCDTEVKDCNTELKDCNIEVKDCNTGVKDVDTGYNDGDTEVKEAANKVKCEDTMKGSDIREKDTEMKETDTEVKDSDTEVKYIDTEVKDSDTEVKDSDTEVKESDTEVKGCGTKGKDCGTEVKDTDIEVHACNTDCDTVVKDSSTERKDIDTEVKNGNTEKRSSSIEVKHYDTEQKDNSSAVKVNNIELMDCGTEMKDGGTEMKDGGTEMKDSGTEMKDGSTEMKDGGSEMKDGGTEMKDGSTEMKDSGTEMEDDGTEITDDSTEMKDGGTEMKDGCTENKDVDMEVKDHGTEVKENENKMKDNGTAVKECDTSISVIKDKSCIEKCGMIAESNNTKSKNDVQKKEMDVFEGDLEVDWEDDNFSEVIDDQVEDDNIEGIWKEQRDLENINRKSDCVHESKDVLNCNRVEQDPVCSERDISEKGTVTSLNEQDTGLNEQATSQMEPVTSQNEQATDLKEPVISQKEQITSSKEPATTAKEPATSADEPSTSAEEPATSAKEPATSAMEPVTNAKQPTTSAKEPATSAKKPVTSAEEQITSSKEPANSANKQVTSTKEPASSAKEPAISAKEPATSAEEPATSEEESASSAEEPATSAKEPATSAKEPATSAEEPATSAKETFVSSPITCGKEQDSAQNEQDINKKVQGSSQSENPTGKVQENICETIRDDEVSKCKETTVSTSVISMCAPTSEDQNVERKSTKQECELQQKVACEKQIMDKSETETRGFPDVSQCSSVYSSVDGSMELFEGSADLFSSSEVFEESLVATEDILCSEKVEVKDGCLIGTEGRMSVDVKGGNGKMFVNNGPQYGSEKKQNGHDLRSTAANRQANTQEVYGHAHNCSLGDIIENMQANTQDIYGNTQDCSLGDIIGNTQVNTQAVIETSQDCSFGDVIPNTQANTQDDMYGNSQEDELGRSQAIAQKTDSSFDSQVVHSDDEDEMIPDTQTQPLHKNEDKMSRNNKKSVSSMLKQKHLLKKTKPKIVSTPLNKNRSRSAKDGKMGKKTVAKRRLKSVNFANDLFSEERISAIDFKMCSTPSPQLLVQKKKSCLKTKSSTPLMNAEGVSDKGEGINESLPNSEGLFTPSPIFIPSSSKATRKRSSTIPQRTGNESSRNHEDRSMEDIIPSTAGTPLFRKAILGAMCFKITSSDITTEQQYMEKENTTVEDSLSDISSSDCLFSESENGSVLCDLTNARSATIGVDAINRQKQIHGVKGTAELESVFETGIENLASFECSGDLFSDASCYSDSQASPNVCKKLCYT